MQQITVLDKKQNKAPFNARKYATTKVAINFY